MEIKKIHWIGITLSLIIIISSLFFIETEFFFFMIGIGVLIGVSPFVLSVINETKIANEKEEMFLEFSRNLVESVKTGTPISKSIINIKDKSYGVLSENVEKLANQISLGIPLNFALKVFAKDVNELLEKLKILGVTHIIFNKREGTRLNTQYQYLHWKTAEDEAKFWEFYRNHLKLLHTINDSELLEIVFSTFG